MIVDAHAHFYAHAGPQPTGQTHGAPSGAVEVETVTEHVLLAAAADAGVDRALQVTPVAMGFDNTATIAGATEHRDRLRAVVRVDPGDPDVGARIDEVLADPIVVGVRMTRHPLHGSWPEDGTLDGLLAALAERTVPLAVYAPNRHLALLSIAERFEQLPLLVDHVAVDVMPGTPLHHRLDGWEHLATLAARPNTSVKLTGLFEATEEEPPYRRTRDLIREVCDVFGPERVHWGSNFPVCTRVCSYATALDVTREACSHLTAPEADLVFGGSISTLLGITW